MSDLAIDREVDRSQMQVSDEEAIQITEMYLERKLATGH